MKTLLLSLSLVFFSGLAFGQSKDLTKKQAYQMFVKSNVRKALGYKTKDFEKVYNTKSSILKLDRESIILNSIKDKDELMKIQMYHARKPCIDCANIIYESEKTAIEIIQ